VRALIIHIARNCYEIYILLLELEISCYQIYFKETWIDIIQIWLGRALSGPLFNIVSDSPTPLSRWWPLLKTEIFIIVYCCLITSQNELLLLVSTDSYRFCIYWEKKSPWNLLLRNWNDLWSKMDGLWGRSQVSLFFASVMSPDYTWLLTFLAWHRLLPYTRDSWEHVIGQLAFINFIEKC
jgi:hypothetical protein